MDLLDRGFAEKRVYQKGKGLTQLVQMVEDKGKSTMSMTWTLEEFREH